MLKQQDKSCYLSSFYLTLEDLKTTLKKDSEHIPLKMSIKALQAITALSSTGISIFLVSSQITSIRTIQIYPSNSPKQEPALHIFSVLYLYCESLLHKKIK